MTGKRRAASPAGSRAGRNASSGRGRKVFKVGGIAFLVLTLLGVLSFAVLYRAIDVPDPNTEFQTETTFVYYADGKSELGTFATQNRDSLPWSELPETMKQAVVAAEDRSFWTNQGLDPRGIIRAAFSNAQGNATQGASTITQQYVKILYLTQERSYERKLKEAFVSLKLHRQQSKEQILAGYLNTIYFGRGAYGVEAAAHAFFDKPAARLNVRESAALAAIINNPTRFDPANGRESRQALKGRYEYVLDGMAELGHLDAAKADRAARKLPKFPKVEGEQKYAGQRGHALSLIRSELSRLGFTENEINGGGLRVTTTLTRKAMNAAREGVMEVRPKGLKGLHTAVASVQPGTGALRGFFGGQDYLRSQINWAVAGGQPGSSFKPFALAAGLNDGYSLKHRFQGNSPYEFPNGDTVNNLGPGEGTDYGELVDLVRATVQSINTAYIDLTMSMPKGPQKVLDMATALGIPKKRPKEASMNNLHDSPGLDPTSGIALGSATVSPINMANAYATIANGGEAAPVHVIKKVVDATGETRYQHKTRTKSVLDRDIAADVSYALQQVVEDPDGSGTAAQALGRPAAGKTGTATNNEDRVSSAWFVGYTPQMATAVMYTRGRGNESLEGFLVPHFGGSYPAQTWTSVMRRLMQGVPVEEFPPPAFVEGDAPEEEHEPYTPPPPPPTTSEPEPEPEPSPTRTTEEPSEEPTTEEPEPTPEPTETQQPGPDCDENPDHPLCLGDDEESPTSSPEAERTGASRETDSPSA